jgi:hypothetical protein
MIVWQLVNKIEIKLKPNHAVVGSTPRSATMECKFCHENNCGCKDGKK